MRGPPTAADLDGIQVVHDQGSVILHGECKLVRELVPIVIDEGEEELPALRALRCLRDHDGAEMAAVVRQRQGVLLARGRLPEQREVDPLEAALLEGVPGLNGAYLLGGVEDDGTAEDIGQHEDVEVVQAFVVLSDLHLGGGLLDDLPPLRIPLTIVILHRDPLVLLLAAVLPALVEGVFRDELEGRGEGLAQHDVPVLEPPHPQGGRVQEAVPVAKCVEGDQSGDGAAPVEDLLLLQAVLDELVSEPLVHEVPEGAQVAGWRGQGQCVAGHGGKEAGATSGRARD